MDKIISTNKDESQLVKLKEQPEHILEESQLLKEIVAPDEYNLNLPKNTNSEEKTIHIADEKINLFKTGDKSEDYISCQNADIQRIVSSEMITSSNNITINVSESVNEPQESKETDSIYAYEKNKKLLSDADKDDSIENIFNSEEEKETIQGIFGSLNPNENQDSSIIDITPDINTPTNILFEKKGHEINFKSSSKRKKHNELNSIENHEKIQQMDLSLEIKRSDSSDKSEELSKSRKEGSNPLISDLDRFSIQKQSNMTDGWKNSIEIASDRNSIGFEIDSNDQQNTVIPEEKSNWCDLTITENNKDFSSYEKISVVDQIQQYVFSRENLADHVTSPNFNQINGGLIRVSMNNGYKICRIHKVVEHDEYFYNHKGLSYTLDIYFCIDNEIGRKKIPLTNVSNAKPDNEDDISDLLGYDMDEIETTYNRINLILNRKLLPSEEKKLINRKRMIILNKKQKIQIYRQKIWTMLDQAQRQKNTTLAKELEDYHNYLTIRPTNEIKPRVLKDMVKRYNLDLLDDLKLDEMETYKINE